MTVFKKSLFFVAFFVIFLLNITLLIHVYNRSQFEKKQRQIISELPQTNSKDKQYAVSAAPLVLGTVESEVIVDDGRAANLRNFFRRYESPLYDYADLIIQISDKYKLDYRILPAIAMQESQACLKIPPGSNNCWRWGIYGDQVMRFSSYEEAIETVAAGIKRNYVDTGLITPEDVMKKYTPSSNGSWANAVTYFFKVLD